MRVRLAGSTEWITPTTYLMPMGVAPSDANHVDIQCQIWQYQHFEYQLHAFGPSVTPGSERLVWTGTVDRIKVVDRPAHAMTPTTSPVIETRLFPPFAWRVLDYGDRDVRLAVSIQHDLPRDIAIGLKVDIFNEGRLRGRAELLRPYNSPHNSLCITFWEDDTVEWIDNPPTREELTSGAWTAHIVGDPAVAARDPINSLYWSGSATVKLAH